jgi:hypothetical protein
VDAHAGDQAVGQGMAEALDRVGQVLGLGTGAVDVSAVAPVKLAELARYGMTAKAPKIEQLSVHRRVATLLATVRELEGASVDDVLLLCDLLMSTKVLSRASRAGDKEKLNSLPTLRIAAARMAAGWTVMINAPQADGEKVTIVGEMWERIERVVSREQLAAAVEMVLQMLPSTEGTVI